MHYDDFNIRLEPKGDDSFKVSVESPAGNDSSLIKLTRSVDELVPILRALGQTLRGNESGGPDGEWATNTRGVLFRNELVAEPTEIGKTLYSDLFVGAAGSKFNHSLGHVKGRQKGLRIKLHIDPEDPDVARLASLPWELLCHPDMGDQPLALSTETPLVRYLNSPRPLNLSEFQAPLRILVVVSNPQGVAPLDLDKERASIEATWGNRDDVEVDFLEKATIQELSNALALRDYHILHYMGHGDFDPDEGVGVLLMETESKTTDPVDGRTLGVVLENAASLRMVFVNACNTAQSTPNEGMDPYAGIAASLVMSGIPAVVAMQFPISDRAAVVFTNCLYPRLAQGLPLDTAVAEARKAIRLADRHSLEWATPVLFMRSPNGRLFEAAEVADNSRSSRSAEQPPPISQNVAHAASEEHAAAVPPIEKTRRRFGPPRAGIAALAIAAVIAIGTVIVANVMDSPADGLSSSVSLAEHERFLSVANARNISTDVLNEFSSDVLRTTLQMKALALSGNQQDLNVLFDEHTSMADPESSVILYLASQIDDLTSFFESKGITTESLVPGLITASQRGNSLATIWIADRMKAELDAQYGSAEFDRVSEQYNEYCATLRLAAAQGLTEIAIKSADTAQCVL